MFGLGEAFTCFSMDQWTSRIHCANLYLILSTVGYVEVVWIQIVHENSSRRITWPHPWRNRLVGGFRIWDAPFRVGIVVKIILELIHPKIIPMICTCMYIYILHMDPSNGYVEIIIPSSDHDMDVYKGLHSSRSTSCEIPEALRELQNLETLARHQVGSGGCWLLYFLWDNWSENNGNQKIECSFM